MSSNKYLYLLLQDILRKWCRTTSNFQHLQTFTREENSLKFVVNLLDRYLTNDILNGCFSDDILVSLTTAVMHLTIQNPSLMHHLEKLLIRLTQLESNEEINKCLCNALQMDLGFKLTTKEEIYISQKFLLVEKPLLDNFVLMSSNLNEENIALQDNHDKSLNQLLEFSSTSKCVFQLVFSFLKELLVRMQYAPAITNFIELILKRVYFFCQNQNGDILNLYPRKLHSCIILLKIKPEYHTAQTKEYTLQSMKEILTENKDALLILMSHFPEWLELFGTYIANDTRS